MSGASWPRVLGFGLVFGVLLALGAVADDGDRNPYIHRRLPARRMSTPPTIDGDLSDPVWQEAAVGEDFTDQKTFKLARNQTRFWLGYDDTAIYLAAHLYDAEPDKLVMRETKRDGRLWGDDHLEFQIDPYHTHDWDDFSSFMVNPLGTQSSQMGGGRSGKTEWKGDWQAAARVVEDGWVVEMAIPWSILNYPSTDGPTTIGFNVSRNHARENYRSWYSNIGRTWRNDWAADWVGVELPASNFQPELLALPFLAAGATERDATWDRTARAGLDVRFRPTPQLTALATVNPDFRNVQSQVESIDFSRGEKWVRESRPFFEEGNDMFETRGGLGQYFYSRRIQQIDVGAKVYGKLAKRTNVGFLGAFDFDDQHGSARRLYREDYVASMTQGFSEWGTLATTAVVRRSDKLRNTVLAYRAGVRIKRQMSLRLRYGSSAYEGPEGEESRAFLRGDTGNVSFDWWTTRTFAGFDLDWLSPGFRAVDGFFKYPGRRSVSFFTGYRNEWRDRYVREFSTEVFANYGERYDRGFGFADFDGLVRRAFSTLGDRADNTHFFKDGFGVNIRFETQGNWGLHHSSDIGHFREEDAEMPDFDWSTGLGLRKWSADRKRGIGIGFEYGRADGVRRRFAHVGFGWKWGDRFSINYRISILRHRDKRQQHIFGINYDLTRSMTLGGRLVFERDDIQEKNTWNPYLSFRRSGEAGIETFLILGDPSGDRFVPRLEGKVLFPL